MKLADYLAQKKIRRSAFAEMVGVSPTIVTHWCSGQAWPSADTAERIYRATRGAVTPNDFLAERIEKQAEPLINVTHGSAA